MAIVYRHRRLDTNEIFYIGIGKEEKRAFTNRNRNKHWYNIVNKVLYVVEIIYKEISWEDAQELEMFLIELYGRRDLGIGTLVNMTDGGDGCLGLISTQKGLTKENSEMVRNRTVKLTGQVRTKIFKKNVSISSSITSLGNTNRRVGIHYITENNETISFDSITEASIILDVKITSIINNIKGLSKFVKTNKGKIKFNYNE